MRDYFATTAASPMGRTDVRLKMAIGVSVSLLVVLADSLASLAALAGVGALLFVACRPNRSQWRLALVSCGLMAWGLLFSQALFYSRFPRHALVTFLDPNWLFEDGITIYAEGLWHGLVQSLRLTAVILTGYAVCFSSEPDQFLRGLTALRVPFSLAFMAVSAIRSIPVVAQEFQTVRLAMRLKGYRPLRRGLRQTVSSEVASLRPVLAGAIRRSQEVALSILTRGFAFGGVRTSLYQERLSPRERAAATAVGLLVLLMTACKTAFWLYQQELYYAPFLRPVYALARHWL